MFFGASRSSSIICEIWARVMNIQTRAAGILSAEEETELAQLWRHAGCEQARARLVMAYSRLCHAWARRLAPGSAHHDDLAQEGIIGLMEAIRRYEPERGFRLGTYANWWIRAAIQDALVVREANSAGMTGATRRIAVMAPRARARAIREIRRMGLPEDPEAILARTADHLGVSVAALTSFEFARNTVSLNAPLSDTSEGVAEFVDLLPGGDLDGEGSVIERQKVSTANAALETLLRTLDAREADILRRRHFCDGRGETLREIGEDYGVSAERIRQIERDALAKLAAAGSEFGLREILDDLID